MGQRDPWLSHARTQNWGSPINASPERAQISLAAACAKRTEHFIDSFWWVGHRIGRELDPLHRITLAHKYGALVGASVIAQAELLFQNAALAEIERTGRHLRREEAREISNLDRGAG